MAIRFILYLVTLHQNGCGCDRIVSVCGKEFALKKLVQQRRFQFCAVLYDETDTWHKNRVPLFALFQPGNTSSVGAAGGAGDGRCEARDGVKKHIPRVQNE